MSIVFTRKFTYLHLNVGFFKRKTTKKRRALIAFRILSIYPKISMLTEIKHSFHKIHSHYELSLVIIANSFNQGEVIVMRNVSDCRKFPEKLAHLTSANQQSEALMLNSFPSQDLAVKSRRANF
jgi:hypothetical protein